VTWRVERETQVRSGVLVGVSESGLALLTERAISPKPGMRILPTRQGEQRGWSRSARVTRVEPLSDLLDLIAAEYSHGPRTQGPGESGTTRTPERRSLPRGIRDRRRSARWMIDRPIRWRVYRGRRARAGRIIERSNDGLVLLVEARDLPKAGTRVYPAGSATRDWLGFASAVVRRREQPNSNIGLVFAEIES
jgi:hypothetical protein